MNLIRKYLNSTINNIPIAELLEYAQKLGNTQGGYWMGNIYCDCISHMFEIPGQRLSKRQSSSCYRVQSHFGISKCEDGPMCKQCLAHCILGYRRGDIVLNSKYAVK